MEIKRIRCEMCGKYIKLSRTKTEIQIERDQITQINHCPNCGRILMVTITAKNRFKYVEILGASS